MEDMLPIPRSGRDEHASNQKRKKIAIPMEVVSTGPTGYLINQSRDTLPIPRAGRDEHAANQ